MTPFSFSEKKKLSDRGINKISNREVNRGVDLILNGGKKKQSKPFHIIFEKMVCFFKREVTIYFEFSLETRKKSWFPEVRTMLAVSLVFGSFLTILFLVVGLIGGWTAREYMMNYREVPRPHPEMFDNQGNLIPDEVIAFNFENYYDDSEESDDNES